MFCFFKKKKDEEKRIKVEFFFCLYSYLTYENMTEQTCEMVCTRGGERPWEAHDVIITLIFSMAAIFFFFLKRDAC